MENQHEKLQNKLIQAQDLLKAIQQKKKRLTAQTELLREFNGRMELLLECFEAYSFEGEPTQIKNPGVDARKVEAIKADVRKVEAIKAETIKTKLEEPIKRSRTQMEELDPRPLEEIFGRNVSARSLAGNLIEIIQAGGSIPLDALVKEAKQSRYKVVETLNVLVREKIVMKNFEKGFVYRIYRASG